jgi:hypothetical protein
MQFLYFLCKMFMYWTFFNKELLLLLYTKTHYVFRKLLIHLNSRIKKFEDLVCTHIQNVYGDQYSLNF